MAVKNPQVVTIYGRLSYPTWTAKAAYERSLKGKYPAADVASAAPDFNLLVEQAQLDKLVAHIENEFFPFLVQRHAAGEAKNAMPATDTAKLLDSIKGDLAAQTLNTAIKAVPEKSADLAPEAVASVKVIGNKGVDFELKAIVNGEDELLVPDPDLLTFPVIKPIGQTVHSMYGGAYVAATLNLYGYYNGKHPGFSAGAGVAVFKADGDRFGGGVTVDEDEIFLD